MTKAPYWKTTALAQMSREQWERLCDGCGRCCLHKVEDTDTDEIFYTSVACRLLDTESCRCRHYRTRHRHVDDCIELRPEHLGNLGWLPETCAYRLLDEGKDLPHWHPLVSGDPDSVHRAGISVSGKVCSADGVSEDEYEEYLVDWVAVGRRTCPEVP
ncbi:MAG: YcgN family cysteine cluster protein [Gammaproteobacteria bacterium]|nr:YcgN family cysteine cluster protein [Gammaproteobacteria bacterium]